MPRATLPIVAPPPDSETFHVTRPLAGSNGASRWRVGDETAARVVARASSRQSVAHVVLAEQRSRLSSLAKLLVPYRADTTVERGVTVTREVLRATSELARAHGATPLLVVLQFGHEAQPEQMLRRRILDNASIPYVFVEIDSSWRLPWDRHPNARAARAIATAIESELRGRLTIAGPSK